MSRETAHPTGEELLLHRYEPDAAVAEHLASCAGCREQLAEDAALLEQLDSSAVPERGETYGREVWRRLEPRLPLPRASLLERFTAVFSPRALALGGAMAVLALVAFLAGQRFPAGPQALSADARERILLAAVGDHLQRSQLVLMELANTAPSGAGLELQRSRASDLVSAGRLYRQAATRSGEPALADLLDELERLLLEIARRPITDEDAAELKRRLESGGILFKVRVVGEQLRAREQRAATAGPTI